MRVFDDITGPLYIVFSMVTAGILVRRRRYRAWQVITAPSAVPVRLSLLVALGGVGVLLAGAGLLTGAWAVLIVDAAIIAWEVAVQVTALVRRRGPRARSAGG